MRTDANDKPLRRDDGTWDYVPGPDDGRVLLWPSWRSIPPVYRSMIEWRGDIYGVPMSNSANGLMFRRDAFARAGLDPERPPATWDDVFAASLRISAASTSTAPVFGLQLNNSVVESVLLGQGGDFARVETDAAGRARWVSTVDSPEMEATLRYMRKLTLTRWIIDPAGAPFIVWEPDRDTPLPLEHVTLGTGRWDGDPVSGRGSVVFTSRSYGPSEIRQGVALNQLGGQTGGNQKWYGLFTLASPRLGMAMNTPETLGTFTAAIDGSLLGFGPAPAGPRGAGVQAQGQIAGLNYELADDPAKARLAWAVVGFLASEDYRGRLVRSYVREGAGIAETLPPALLAQHGYETLAERIPTALQDYWNTLDSVVRPVVPAKNFQAITQQYLGPLYREATLNASFDYRTALADARRQIQARLDFAAGDYSGVSHRGLIIAGMIFIVVAVLVASCYAIKSMLAKAAATRAVGTLPPNPHLQNLAWLLMAPALLLISVFAYLPIFKALPIAFQDYHVTGASAWVGSANFVEMFSNPATWAALLKTFYYMTLSIGIGFLAPVVLAILMSEIRSCRYFMRTVYYLPAVVAGIVMLLLWQRFFEATPT
ncbi:MAG: extracellular solute-binding protein, partial [Opitutaceae bacterium]|nr:extracellular solute-binding protein [Opitutaceae bacterium]